MAWIRISLIVVCALCALGALLELRVAWRWVIGPAVGLLEAPLRVESEVAFVAPKANAQPKMTQSIGETRFRGSTGYIASATFEDESGLLRIVHGEGLFASPEKGRVVTVAYRAELPDPSLRPPANSPAPTEAAGTLLTFDILYGRACLYAFLAGVTTLLLVAFERFGLT